MGKWAGLDLAVVGWAVTAGVQWSYWVGGQAGTGGSGLGFLGSWWGGKWAGRFCLLIGWAGSGQAALSQ